MHVRLLACAALICTLAAPLKSQTPAPLPADITTHAGWPAAAPGDVDTVDHLVAALYDVISGPPTKPRDWQRFRSLFLPSGRMGVIRPDMAAANGKPARVSDVIFLTPEQYVERDDPYFKANGFFERGIANRVEQFGNLTSVWSTYESRHAAGDAKPFARGINSLQIVHAQGRYWVASIMWDDERDGLTLPEKYLR